MSQLLVFIGKPGVGKTTIIENLEPRIEHVDVLPFVQKYIIDGVLQEDKTIVAYKEMYDSLEEKLLSQNTPLILELGTNHAPLNIEKLGELMEKNHVSIFLCDASIDICRERALERDRVMASGSLERRLSRDFPNSHTILLKEKKNEFILLDMAQPLEENINIIQKHIINLSP